MTFLNKKYDEWVDYFVWMLSTKRGHHQYLNGSAGLDIDACCFYFDNVEGRISE